MAPSPPIIEISAFLTQPSNPDGEDRSAEIHRACTETGFFVAMDVEPYVDPTEGPVRMAGR